MSRADAAGAVRRRAAPAKINLALHVVGRRDDGYHLLDMLVAFADIGDRVSWTPGGDGCRLILRDRFDRRPEPVPETTANLAWQALALAGRLGGGGLTGTLEVEKHLPSGAGIGGGSSDAAAVLRAVLGDKRAADDTTAARALALGADLPVCLADRPARVRGIGDRIVPLKLTQPLPVVLVWPGAGLSTPAVFRARTGGFGAPIPDGALDDLTRDPLGTMTGLRNDLEAAARRLLPIVGTALDTVGARDGCRVARMSGSGSTVVGYFVSGESAQAAEQALAAAHPDWWVRATELRPSQRPEDIL